jgi:hypothetical protein
MTHPTEKRGQLIRHHEEALTLADEIDDGLEPALEHKLAFCAARNPL